MYYAEKLKEKAQYNTVLDKSSKWNKDIPRSFQMNLLELNTVSAPIQPHSWIDPHPLSFHARNNFLCVFYVVILGQKSILKNRYPGLY